MNPEFNEWLNSESDSALPTARPPALGWRQWLRRLLVCNPFFLGSAALLLFGVNRLSIDPTFLPEEKSNLLFNYFALQIYEVLVVAAAIVLARRKIWYDSALLVVVENGLMLVPFMLISQGTLLAPSLGIKLAAGAFVLAVARAFAIRSGYPQFNLPPRALAFGIVLLLLNAALPAVFPSIVEKDLEEWTQPNLFLWYVALPLLVAAANLLPRPTRYGGLNPERHWLPIFNYTLWVLGTGVHIWSLGYISKHEFHIQYLGPAATVAAWTLWHRIGDFVLRPSAKWEMALLGLTFVAPLISFGNPKLFALLVMLNAAAYGVLMLRRDGALRALLKELIFASLGMLLVNSPPEIGRVLPSTFAVAHPTVLAIAAMICLFALRRAQAVFGVAGAVAAGIIAVLVWPSAPKDLFVQVMAVFLLAHSLAWPQKGALASLLRVMACALWIIDSGVWIHQSSWSTGLAIGGTAIVLLATSFIVGRFMQQRDWFVIASSASVAFAVPGDWLIRQGSYGLLALALSLATFAVGFAIAWTRHRWETTNQTVQ